MSRILSLIAGYVVSIFYSKPFSVMLESGSQLQGLVAYIIAALVLFLGASLIVVLFFRVIERWLAPTESISTGSRVGGSTVGLMTGIIVAIIIVWAFNFFNQIRPNGNSGSSASAEDSAIGNLANRVAGNVVGTAMTLGSAKPETVKLGRAIIEAPAEVAQQVQRLAHSNDLQALLIDPNNQRVLDSGDVDAVRELPALRQLASNPDMLQLAKSAGMIDRATTDSDAVEQALARNITDIWGRVQRVKNDQRVQKILADPEFQEKLNSGNPIDLLTNASLLELADIVFSDDAPASYSGNDDSGNDDSGNDDSDKTGADTIPTQKPVTQLYTWTDKKGRVHYSDTEPDPASQQ